MAGTWHLKACVCWRHQSSHTIRSRNIRRLSSMLSRLVTLGH